MDPTTFLASCGKTPMKSQLQETIKGCVIKGEGAELLITPSAGTNKYSRPKASHFIFQIHWNEEAHE
ncbi:hypothetical protein HPP92_024995 [Vanilla planifolia]|uniref:Uncharacterized protein n=1 Tax=Vanilla planifolia TaxID=51239 RepID=A0A835PK47_VANPL|nr:hypothetical protein HPP92_024995 [Vanilla planifolia]